MVPPWNSVEGLSFTLPHLAWLGTDSCLLTPQISILPHVHKMVCSRLSLWSMQVISMTCSPISCRLLCQCCQACENNSSVKQHKTYHRFLWLHQNLRSCIFIIYRIFSKYALYGRGAETKNWRLYWKTNSHCPLGHHFYYSLAHFSRAEKELHQSRDVEELSFIRMCLVYVCFWVKHSGKISKKRLWLSKRKLLRLLIELSICLWWSCTNLFSSNGWHWLDVTFFKTCVLLKCITTYYASCVWLIIVSFLKAVTAHAHTHLYDCAAFKIVPELHNWGRLRWRDGAEIWPGSPMNETAWKRRHKTTEQQQYRVIFYEHSSTASTWLC